MALDLTINIGEWANSLTQDKEFQTAYNGGTLTAQEFEDVLTRVLGKVVLVQE